MAAPDRTPSNDPRLLDRVSAAYEARGEANPQAMAMLTRDAIDANAAITTAYTAAITADNADPGGDTAVVTDAMINAVLLDAAPADGPQPSTGTWDPLATT